MLKSLFIKNYVLINKLELDFSKGFSVFTGETGAGKSILLGALGLLLGDRADMSEIGNKDEKCIVEGVFDIEKLGLNNFFVQNNLEYEGEISVRRILSKKGKSRAFINEIPVNLQLLKKLTFFLIDIHSQHQNLLVKDSDFQLSVIDSFAQNSGILEKYKLEFKSYLEKKKRYKNLCGKNEQEKQNLEFYNHQLGKFEILDLENLDLKNLEQEFEMMQNSSVIQQNFDEINYYLDGEDGSIIDKIKKVLSNLSDLKKHFLESAKLTERLNDVLIEVSDINHEINNLETQILSDPQRLEYLQSQMSLIYQLFEVFRVQKISELLQKKQELESKIEEISMFEAKIISQKLALKKQKEDLRKQANKITEQRKIVFSEIEKSVVMILQKMGMPHVQFVVNHEISKKLSLSGQDYIRFLFSSNLGNAPQDLSKSASGGEISRIMFCLKSLLSDFSGLPTIIFDEIDMGISGEIAEKMGELMKQMGKSRQIFTITHLPQIAVKGDHHFLVKKEYLLGTTTTNIYKISERERIKEIAKMLSGSDIGEDALKHVERMMGK